jgi:triphosphatase
MTTPQPQEIELKLALPPQQADAFLKRMARRRSAPVRQELVTRYFDTPDFALSAQGVALRVRRIGRRWLQTLKTEGERQGGLSKRVEYEMPVPRGMPVWDRFPAEAQAFVPEALRETIEPVFETRFIRTAWLLKGKAGAQIEVALDVGEVRTLKGVHAVEGRQPICEIELELKSGQPDALFALALEWAGDFGCLPFDVSKAERGVRLAHGIEAAPVKAVSLALDAGMSVEAGFAAIVQACLAQFQANLPGVIFPSPSALPEAGEGANAKPTAGPLPSPLPQVGEGANAGPKTIDDDIEYVHQARVALRRLRAALRLFRRVCVLPDELLDGLRALVAALGPARDWDVLCSETLPAIAPHYPDPARWQSGLDALQAHRAGVRAAMQAALAGARPGAWLLAMQHWLLQHGWRVSASGEKAPEAQRFEQLSPLEQWARRALKRGHRRVERGARAFAQLQPPERHALRIAIKRQRYAAEFFETLFAGLPDGHKRRQAKYLALLRDAQDSLGRANDARIAAELMAAAPPQTGPMGDFVRGWLAAGRAGADDSESARLMRDFLDARTYW